MIDTTNFNRAKDLWDSTDKDMLGEDDVEDLIDIVSDLYRLCEHYQKLLGGNSNGNRPTTLAS